MIWDAVTITTLLALAAAIALVLIIRLGRHP